MSKRAYFKGCAVMAGILGVMFLYVTASGCTIHLRDQGKVAITYGSTLTFEHVASKTDATSEATTDFKPTADLIDSLKNEDAPGDVAGSGEGG